ncbi:unnamed protein product [Pedinophyceae sp. YPF-701]|nr:unnamed protein product [Pedinophyceae sp. YPF-701]
MVATRASRARAGDAAPPARSPSPKTRKVRTKDAARVASPSRRATSPKPRKSRKESAPGSKSNTEAAPAAGADVAGWAKSTDELVRFLGTSVSKGLSPEEAARRLEQYGPNELQKDPPTPLWKLVLEQFEDLLVRLLLMAAVVSFALAYMDSADGEEGLRAYIEPLVILLILVLNAVVGVWQETNAEAALDALKEMQADRVRCTRGGKVLSDLDARELVPGDVVTLAAGDRVPADCRLVSMVTTIVRVDQAALTGESQPVNKEEALVLEEECDILSKENMLFSGTALVSGSCKVVVCSTGMGTEIGAVQAQIQTASEEDNDTPLKRKLDEFGTQLAKVISLICLLVWGMNYSKFLSWTPHATLAPLPDPASIRVDVAGCTYYFKIAVALAVAAIPEGLPAVITTCLALGTRSMAKKKAIVRRLPSVETLGCTTVICSDKTGTLTTNQMTCVRLVSLDDKGQVDSRTVSGQTYDPEDGAVEGLTARTLDAAHLGLATVGAVCNDAHIERDAQSGLVKAVGTPTEACLVTLAEKIGRLEGAGNAGAGPAPWAAAAAARAERIATLEFDRDRKSMSVLAAGEGVVAGVSDGGNTLLCKGAAECVLERCDRYLAPSGKPVPMSAGVRKTLAAEIEAMASQALRTLALAARAGSEMGPLGSYDGDHAHPGHKTMQDPKLYPEVESKMVFLGMVGIQVRRNRTVLLSFIFLLYFFYCLSFSPSGTDPRADSRTNDS